MNSGIYVTPDLSQQWNAVRVDQNVSVIKIGITEQDAFAITHKAPAQGDVIAQAAQLLEPREPAYVLIRTAPGSDKFYIIFYVPNGSKISKKMIYSSSLNSLKSGLGTDYLSSEVYITSPDECSLESIQLSTHTPDRLKMMTMDERLAHDAAYSQTSLETTSKVSVDLPVTANADTKSAFAAYQSGTVKTVLLGLNQDTEQLEVISKGNQTLDEVSSLLQPAQPCYILHKFNHTHPQTNESKSSNLFIYFCPEKARPKLKMFFSAAKSLVVKLLEEEFNIPREAHFESSDAREVNTQDALRELYPVHEERVRHAKPRPGGRGQRKMDVNTSAFD